MPSYKFYYGEGRGRGEVIRLVFAAAGIKYEDIRVKWPDGDEWLKIKASGKSPFNQIPFLEVDGKTLGQSGAILRYVAKQGGLCPDDCFEEARANMIADSVVDLFNAVVKFHFEKDETKKKEQKDEYEQKTLPPRLESFTAQLQGKEYFAGDKLTYADITFFDLFNNFMMLGKPGIPDALKKFPPLVDHYNRVMANPGIKAWLDNRPQSAY